MKKVRFYKGLPGSGKTYHAESWVKENPNVSLICKDDIRRDYFGVIVGDESTRVKEKKVVAKRDELIMDALQRGKDIAVCDTNLNPLHEKNVKALVFPKYRDYEFEIVDFTDVPVETCIERCAKRPEGKEFWAKVIMKMKNEYMVPRKLYTEHGYFDGVLPKAVIFDLDGTLALIPERDGKRCGRSPFEDERCHEDIPNVPVVEIAQMYCARPDVTVICLSGRKEDTGRVPTENWLAANGIKYDYLYMRKAGDSRRDSIIKRELFDEHIRGKYNIHLVVDDRMQVCKELWVEEGLPLMQVGNPYHEF